MTLGEIATALGCTVQGREDITITGVATLDTAGPTHLTFLANPKYASRVKTSKAAAVFASKPVEGAPMATVISANPYLDFSRALAMFYQAPRPAAGIHALASVDPSAIIGEGASIGPFAVVGPRVTIGRHVVIHPHVVLYEGVTIGDDFTAHAHASVREFCRIGHRVTLQNGVVIGGDGFGFAKRADGAHEKIVQSGITVIEDDVEVQTLSSVDRATMGETRVKRGTKIDSLVQVGHACVVGEDNIICAQTGLAGSTILEKNVLLAGQVGVGGHLTVHEGVVALGQTGITNDVPAHAVVAGLPAQDAAGWRKAAALVQKLPEMRKELRALKARLEALSPGRTGEA
ncbi:MAG: UDP-3-O-(3-hydroxymyristoyl)glucosamine N-acyltransferase [Vicinamibacterales bacterium]